MTFILLEILLIKYQFFIIFARDSFINLKLFLANGGKDFQSVALIKSCGANEKIQILKIFFFRLSGEIATRYQNHKTFYGRNFK